MKSEGGSQEPLPDLAAKELEMQAMADAIADEPMHPLGEPRRQSIPTHMPRLHMVNLTTEELDRIADGEPYCFRCGKPASSFEEYARGAEDEDLANAWQYVIQEEGTYNPETNRFACLACYIAISLPSGWTAP